MALLLKKFCRENGSRWSKIKRYILKDENFFFEGSNLELVYEEKKLLELVYELILCIDTNLSTLSGNFDTYEGCCIIWAKNIVTYAKEAYNSAQIGNFISFAMMQRCIVENYVCACFIKRYEEERLWEKWFLSSMTSTSNLLKKLTGRVDKHEQFRVEIDELCYERDISIEYDLKATYGWTSEIIKKKKPTFFDLCEYIDKSIYDDYRWLCDFSHGVNAINKVYRFTFVQSYMHLLMKFVLYLQRSFEELLDDIADQSYWKQKQMFWDAIEEWEIEFN